MNTRWQQVLDQKVKVCFIVNSATCTVHTYRELKLRYSYSLVHTDNTKH